MSIAKVIEVIAQGESVEEAVQSAVTEASKSVRDIKSVYVENITGIVSEGSVVMYRANCKLTFVVDD